MEVGGSLGWAVRLGNTLIYYINTVESTYIDQKAHASYQLSRLVHAPRLALLQLAVREPL